MVTSNFLSFKMKIGNLSENMNYNTKKKKTHTVITFKLHTKIYIQGYACRNH